MKMKTLSRLLLIVLAAAFAPVSALAQQRTATINATPSPTAGVTGYNLYRGECLVALVNNQCPSASEGPAVKINPSPMPLPIPDATVVNGKSYYWYLKAYKSPNESAESTRTAATIPPDDPPLPPTNPNVTITTVAMNKWGTTTEVVAEWRGPAGETTAWKLLDGAGQPIAHGTSFSSLGTYSVDRRFTNLRRVPATVTVCDSTAACVSQKL